MDIQYLRKQLQQKQEQLKQQRINKITHFEYYGINQKEAQDIVNIKQASKEQKNLNNVLQIITVNRAKIDLFWSAEQGTYRRLFDQQLTIDFKAKENLIQINKPCLIMINGCKKSKRNKILELYQKQIFYFLDKKKEDGNEILISIVGFFGQCVIDLLSINQDFENILHNNLKIYRDQEFVKMKNVIQISITNEQELEQIITLYKSIKFLIEQQIKQPLSSIVFQFLIGELDGTTLIKQYNKCNIIKINNQQDQSFYYLKRCLGQLNKGEQVQQHNCKLTQCLQDCFSFNYQIIYIGSLITDQCLKSQLSIIQFLDPILQIKSKVTYEKPQHHVQIKDLLDEI